MATPKKLPSGKWRVQVYDKDTRKRVSFTADTKRKADLLAIEWQEGKLKKALIKTKGSGNMSIFYKNRKKICNFGEDGAILLDSFL